MPERPPIHVLVVEDDADTRANLRDILELDDLRVDTVSSGVEALNFPELNSVSAIVLDRKLPDQTAEELLPKLKQIVPDVAVVIVTGYAELDSAIAALRFGAADYILKPINPDALRASLSRIADRKLARDELSDREAKMRSILETATDGIITIDERGIIEALNPAAERIFGYDSAELIGQNVSLLMPSPYREEHDDHITRYVETGQSDVFGRGREVVGRRKDGTTFPAELSVNEARDDRRTFTGIVRDITERKLSEDRLLQAERLAAVGRAMAGLAHESRNALQRSQASLEMLARRIQDRPEAAELVSRIQAAQDDLYRLYEEVREYAAPIRTEPRRCDLSTILHEAWDHLTLKRAGRSIELREQTGDLDVHCDADPFAIQQVFRNVLENALAAANDPVEIDVRFTEVTLHGQPAIRVAIRDNGPGITPDQRQRLFEEFYTTKTHGTGLGLAICRRFVEAHAGRMEVAPETNAGAEIWITLPRKQS